MPQLPQPKGNLFRPRRSERPLYPVTIIRDAADVHPSEVVRFAGIPFANTNDGWVLIDSPDLRGVVDLDD